MNPFLSFFYNYSYVKLNNMLFFQHFGSFKPQTGRNLLYLYVNDILLVKKKRKTQPQSIKKDVIVNRA